MPAAHTEALRHAAENLRRMRRARADELRQARGGKLGSHEAAELLRQAREPYQFRPPRLLPAVRCRARSPVPPVDRDPAR